MFADNPRLRQLLYLLAIVSQVAAFFVRAGDPAGAWADAFQYTANFLGGLAGITALSNLLSKPPAPPN